ncbi:PREDICTED: PH domain leucine-rich repeat-containing protein phosphatase 1 [Bison bison bison]|uniref:PH domain leucine-rich repeat-containing protein phosphatase 1 n=1 Tax=Bison bison bison TaxID=43346 RepID=A0A6P3IFD0_BISBB|nr:PREDICTED: PH domain leucine-rich repeat-containing protein phosphatase 1 [Bison bison bison]
MHLPVNRWTRRQVILCGTCLIVSSVKDSVAGKMHVLPLIGGKVEEVKKHQHCLAFSSSGPQSQTYYICFDTFTEYLRWLRQVSKVASQRISSVDLSCCSLEHLPANLFYSQDLTHLNLKQNFLRQNPSLPTARGLSELQRFTKLKSLNLSNNHLGDFPLAVCNIPTLAELNMSCNALRAVPATVGAMHNLQTFLLDGNFLQTLPAELENMHQLSYLGLSFNEFTDLPEVLQKLTAVEKLCMSGNCVGTLRLQALRKMPHIKHVDLRLNVIRNLIADGVDFLPHVTQLDLRDNKLEGLDAVVFTNLEVLHCERNQLVTLNACGCFLKALYASSNELVQLDVCPVPNYLSYMDVSRNCLENVPEWVCESRKLEVLDIGHNQICELPARLFCNSSLRKLLAGHNRMARLPESLERTSVEVLDVQHNQLLELPPSLLMKADSLRFLNASANKLESLPPATLSEETNSILQELYLTNNNLTDKCVPLLTGHPHLKVLHMAYNRLQSFPASKMAKLEELEEIDLSGNKLKAVPTTILNCRRMHTVTAHSNCIEVFPEVMQLPEIKCVDLSCNELSEVTLPENLPPKLQELDLTGNPRLALDHRTLELLNNIRCFKIDQPSAGDASGAPAVWSHGYTEASGVKNKLCVAALSVNNFCDNQEALYGVFDGDRNVEVPYLLQCTMSDILAEELQKTRDGEECMVNTFIVMQRKLGTAGQKLGGAAVLCHIRHDPVDPGGPFTLTSANVGKCQTVLCRNGKPLPLSRSYVMSCEEELRRIKRHKAIVTEVRVVFLRLWGDWEEAAELAGEHLPRRSVDAKADPRFQIRIHSIGAQAQQPLRSGRTVTLSPPRGAHRGLRPCSLSSSGWAVTPSPPRGAHRGLRPAEVTLPALLSSWLWGLRAVTFQPQRLGFLLGKVGLDEFFILGSKGLWDSLSVEEAVDAVRSVPDALAAAKKLCTLAQSYGCRESVSAVVVQLSVPEDSFCCCELAALPPPSPVCTCDPCVTSHSAPVTRVLETLWVFAAPHVDQLCSPERGRLGTLRPGLHSGPGVRPAQDPVPCLLTGTWPTHLPAAPGASEQTRKAQHSHLMPQSLQKFQVLSDSLVWNPLRAGLIGRLVWPPPQTDHVDPILPQLTPREAHFRPEQGQHGQHDLGVHGGCPAAACARGGRWDQRGCTQPLQLTGRWGVGVAVSPRPAARGTLASSSLSQQVPLSTRPIGLKLNPPWQNRGLGGPRRLSISRPCGRVTKEAHAPSAASHQRPARLPAFLPSRRAEAPDGSTLIAASHSASSSSRAGRRGCGRGADGRWACARRALKTRLLGGKQD